MRARLLAGLAMVLAVTGCDVLGPPTVFPTTVASADATVFEKIRFASGDHDVRLRVHESRVFTVHVSDDAFATVGWHVDPEPAGGEARLLGFMCDRVDSCSVEQSTPSRAMLSVRGTREIRARVEARSPGAVRLWILGQTGACAGAGTPWSRKCGQSHTEAVRIEIAP